ncbi:MAG: TlpA family protein disulfide reductase [Burkholderiaceae bacterium]|nr:TlpA family protein disulfide reductase [Burkholderiaceae bacterium]
MPRRSWRAHWRRGALVVALALGLAGPSTALSLQGRAADGSPLELSALRGRVVMLFFWTTQCPVCLDKLPELRRNLAGWSGQPFVIVAVNHDADRAAYDRYGQLRRQLLPPNAQWIDLWRGDPGHRDDAGPLPAQTPVTVLLDRDGQVRLRVAGRVAPELWDEVAALVLN